MGLEARLEKLERLMGQREETLVVYVERYLEDVDVIGVTVNEDAFHERSAGEDMVGLVERVGEKIRAKNKLGGVFVLSPATNAERLIVERC